TSDEEDVSRAPTLTIPQVMALASDRDDIARELATGFVRLETEITPYLRRQLQSGPLSPVCGGEGQGEGVSASSGLLRDGVFSGRAGTARHALIPFDSLTLALSPADGGEGTGS